MTAKRNANFPPVLSDVPPGYTSAKMPDGHEVLMPNAVIPDFHQAFAAYRTMQNTDVVGVKPKVRLPDLCLYFFVCGGCPVGQSVGVRCQRRVSRSVFGVGAGVGERSGRCNSMLVSVQCRHKFDQVGV